jgi:stearoyl-CoA desaturase (delta-9 desaturase)
MNLLKRINWLESSPFLFFHFFALVGLWIIPFDSKWLILMASLYFLRMFAITAGYHRYFSHRSFKTSRVFQLILAFLAQTSIQKGILWWAAHHRHHHKYSDQKEDIHSPLLSGFWFSHVAWILVDDYSETRTELVRDLTRYPELRFLNRFHILPAILLGIWVYFMFGFEGFFWGFIVGTVILWHGTFTINSLSHVFGWVRYQTTDTSKNNPILAIVTLGEGWHNNHHAYMNCTRQGFFWWEYDITFYILSFLSWFGIVWDLGEVPYTKLEALRIKGDGRQKLARRV